MSNLSQEEREIMCFGSLKVHIIYLMGEMATLKLLIHIKTPVSEKKSYYKNRYYMFKIIGHLKYDPLTTCISQGNISNYTMIIC